MDYTLKLLSEHAELTGKNRMLTWEIEQYEFFINELMTYLCQEDVLGMEYVRRYNSLLKLRRDREENGNKEKY